MSNEPVLKLENICQTFVQGENNLDILRDVNLQIAPGQMAALVAPSGAGKSTLLHIAGLLEKPTSGNIIIDGQDCSGLSDGGRSALRADKIGFVYQFHHLLPEFTAQENIMIPQMIAGKSKSVAKERAAIMLDKVGLGERLHHRPSQLSGGEQQRVAILRALINKPKLLLADEPTGNLDAVTGDTVFGLLQALVRANNMSALIVTHNLDLAKRMDKIYTLRNGQLALHASDAGAQAVTVTPPLSIVQ